MALAESRRAEGQAVSCHPDGLLFCIAKATQGEDSGLHAPQTMCLANGSGLHWTADIGPGRSRKSAPLPTPPLSVCFPPETEVDASQVKKPKARLKEARDT